MAKDKRKVILDILKAFLILLVILGHCIQYCNGVNYFNSELYYNNYLFKIIYSFHMPFFMLISGYLFQKGINKRSFIVELKNKFFRLLVPILSFSIIAFLLRLLVIEKFGFGILTLIIKFIGTVTGSLWFLWAVFLCSMLIKFVHDYMKDNKYIYCIIIVLSFLIPDIQYLSLYKFVFPFFLIGYFLSKKDIKYNTKINKYFPLLMLLFYFLIKNFDKAKFIYTSGYSILNNWGQIYNDIYRFIAGLLGSALIFVFAKMIINEKRNYKFLTFIGKRTLGLYLISSMIFDYVFKIVILNYNDFNYIRTLIFFIIIFSISLIVHIILEKIPIVSNLFLGQSSKKDGGKNG